MFIESELTKNILLTQYLDIHIKEGKEIGPSSYETIHWIESLVKTVPVQGFNISSLQSRAPCMPENISYFILPLPFLSDPLHSLFIYPRGGFVIQRKRKGRKIVPYEILGHVLEYMDVNIQGKEVKNYFWKKKGKYFFVNVFG